MLLLLSVACGDPAVADRSADGAVDTGGGGLIDGSPGDGAPGDVAVDTGPKIAFCQQACSKPADCSTTGGAFDPSHWSCDVGTCRYLGCKTDAECTTSFGGTKAYKCHAAAGGQAACAAACSKAADCATLSAA